MPGSKFYEEIKKAVIERQVEDVYNKGITLYFPNSKGIEYPFACDGFVDTQTPNGKILKLIIEYKFNENLSNSVARAKVLTQVVFYIKRFEQNGFILPNVCLVGDKDECFVMHTNNLLPYLDEEVDWSVSPSKAHETYPDLVLKISQDANINPFVFMVDERFQFKVVAEKIKDLAENVQRYVRVTEHNLSKIFDYFCKNVLKNKNKLTGHDLVEIFMGVIGDKMNYYQHPSNPNVLVSREKHIHMDGKAFEAFFGYFDRTYTPCETMRLNGIADRLIEDVDRRMKGDFWTPTLFVDYAHKKIEECLGYDWKERYVVWDNCWGTGNLTRDYKFRELYCSTLFESELNIGASYNTEAVKFQFDFLNDVIPLPGEVLSGETKMPSGLMEALQEDKPIVFFLNPPYARNSGGGINKGTSESVAFTQVNEWMKNENMGNCSSNLYAQFLYRIIKIKQAYHLSNCYIAVFCPTLFLAGQSFKLFRNLLLKEFAFVDAFQFKASEFADVSDNWGIGFTVLGSKREEECVDEVCRGAGVSPAKGQSTLQDNKGNEVSQATSVINAAETTTPRQNAGGVTDSLPLPTPRQYVGEITEHGQNEGKEMPSSHFRNYLPHKEYHRYQFITFRLYDAVPQDKIFQWRKELNLLNEGEKEDKEAYINLLNKIEKYEDKGYGQCFLKDERVAHIVQETLKFYNGKMYNLVNWCIMPNHVHVLIEFLEGSLSRIMHSWSSYTSHKANKLLGREGTFWMSEYYDRYIRDATHFCKVMEYIDANPIKGGLAESAKDYKWCGVGDGHFETECVDEVCRGAGVPPAKVRSTLQDNKGNEVSQATSVINAAETATPRQNVGGVTDSLPLPTPPGNGKNTFRYALVESDGEEIKIKGYKIVYNADNAKSVRCSDWIRESTIGIKTVDTVNLTNAINVRQNAGVRKGMLVPGALGYLYNSGNNVDANDQGCAFFSSASARGIGCSVTPTNFTRCVALFAARKLIEKKWINYQDEYLVPNESHPLYPEFINDSIIYSLFHSAGNQSSLRNIEYKGKTWNIFNEFFWMSKEEISSLANECHIIETYNDARTANERYVYKLLYTPSTVKHFSVGEPPASQANDVGDLRTPIDSPYPLKISDTRELVVNVSERSKDSNDANSPLDIKDFNDLNIHTIVELSPEAQAVLNKACDIVRKTFKYRPMFDSEHPEYQILNWDCGWYQIKALAKEYAKSDYEEFGVLFRTLADKMRPMVYELGFLR